LWTRLADNPTYTFRSVAALGALGITLIGAVPMAVATIGPDADPILAQAVDGAPQAVNSTAPAFNLVDQHGAPVSLASLRGKTIAFTFLDDTCTSDCPVIASEFRTADDYLAAFDDQEGLEHVANWLYLTGSLPELRRVWRSYGEAVIYLPAGAMVGHSEYAYVIDAYGHTRDVLDTDPGPTTNALESSFSVMLADTIKSVLAHP